MLLPKFLRAIKENDATIGTVDSVIPSPDVDNSGGIENYLQGDKQYNPGDARIAKAGKKINRRNPSGKVDKKKKKK